MVSLRSALKGFLGGSLISFGFFAPWGLLTQALIFFIGIFVLLDMFIPFGEYPYMVTGAVSTVVGIVVTYILIVMQMEASWVMVILLFTALTYFYKSLRRIKPRKFRIRKKKG